jgi:hypothetical protein
MEDKIREIVVEYFGLDGEFECEDYNNGYNCIEELAKLLEDNTYELKKEIANLYEQAETDSKEIAELKLQLARQNEIVMEKAKADAFVDDIGKETNNEI